MINYVINEAKFLKLLEIKNKDIEYDETLDKYRMLTKINNHRIIISCCEDTQEEESYFAYDNMTLSSKSSKLKFRIASFIEEVINNENRSR